MTSAPIAFDARACTVAWERLAAVEKEPDRAAGDIAREVLAEPRIHALLDGVFGNSPFLTQLALRERAWLTQALRQPAETALETLIAQMREQAECAQDRPAFMGALRRARGRVALLIALADLGGAFDLVAVTHWLTRFADECVTASLRRLLREAASKSKFTPKDTRAPETECGFFLLAMGKYGAFELNYSSDIDLIALYDRARLDAAGVGDPASFAVKLAQDLTAMLQRRTEDGYVFRVDLRLRPDGNASPLALSTEAAELYYEAAGQNWERAAMIKARVCAGDRQVGEAFLKALRPYVWRRNLDFAAIEDIHSIKRQIHVHKGHGEVRVLGHNIKLGRGGIREIEFFAQTQQLILGGKAPELRVRATCEALDILAEKRHIEPCVRDELKESYEFLRRLEHRLQMIEDEQTHSLPKTRAGLDHVARFMGYGETAAFESELRTHLARVQSHYAKLFESSETLASEAGSLVFTGVEEDPETLETLARLGYRRGKEISATIRAWHHGRIRATRSARARERLTRLVPILLDNLAKTADPDAAFLEFARFIETAPTGVQLFSLLISNPQLLVILADLFSLAPRLSRTLAERPAILDSLITADGALTWERQAEERALARSLAGAQALEEALDQVRIFARERQFRVAFDVLTRAAEPIAAGPVLTEIAETVIRALVQVAEEEMEKRHGRVAGGSWAVLGMGKLGGREMTATSDLDLVFVYEFDPAHETSAGPRKVSAGEFYARAGQHLISLLTVPTREGKLYEVDMRLRPSGRAGPVAVTLERLKTYHETQAWTFEHMALTRARFIAGAPELGVRALTVVHDILCAPRDLAKLSSDALDMRARLESAKPVHDPWALKLVRGGLVDLEYIAQVLQLALAPTHPEILAASTLEAVGKIAGAGIMTAQEASELQAAARFLSSLSQVMQICYDEERAPDSAHNVRARLAAILGMASYEALEARLIDTEAKVKALFDKWVGELPRWIARI